MLRLGRPRVALVVAPHADDETIGAFELIRQLRRRRTRVRIVVVTDGAASHPGSARWPRRRLVAERRRETRSAMRLAGIHAGRIAFLGLPDGKTTARSQASRRTIARAVRQVRGLDLLVVPSAHDDHPDHRMTALACGWAGQGARRLSYLVWPDRSGRRPPPCRSLKVGSALAKRAAIQRYRTQTGTIADDPAGFTISPRDLARFARPVERYEASAW